MNGRSDKNTALAVLQSLPSDNGWIEINRALNDAAPEVWKAPPYEITRKGKLLESQIVEMVCVWHDFEDHLNKYFKTYIAGNAEGINARWRVGIFELIEVFTRSLCKEIDDGIITEDDLKAVFGYVEKLEGGDARERSQARWIIEAIYFNTRESGANVMNYLGTLSMQEYIVIRKTFHEYF
jgi:hypothetical protein